MRIRRLEDADAVAAGSLLARAFVDAPVFAAALPAREARARLCPDLFVFNVRHACRFGEAWALQDPDGILLAIAYTVDRPEPRLTREEAAALGFPALARGWAPVLDRLGAIEAAAAGQLAGLPEPWRYLGAIGVEPRLQRRGHGAALLAHLLDRAAVRAMPVGLVTDHAGNVPFYEQAGFTIAWHGAPEPGGPSFWAMRTRPAPDATASPAPSHM
ncbi:MAG: GNAT family N-acetyltransferase, partial [Chloroflexota bacterium]